MTYTQVSIDAAVRSMLALPIAERKAARDAIAVSALSQVSRLASGWCRASGDHELTLRDDAEAEGALYFLEALTDLAAGRVPAGVRDYDAYLSTAVTFKISAWIKSSKVTGVTGNSGRTRRAIQAGHTIARFAAEHGREPSAAELTAVFNAEMNGRRANASKQGALLNAAEARTALERHAFLPPRMGRV